MYTSHKFCRPEKDTRENTKFNYYVSKIRIRSEHCVGFLKGRFSSLRGLRRRIDHIRGLHMAIFWVTACIVLHGFAMKHEASPDMTADDFFQDGLQILEEEHSEHARRDWTGDAHMNEGVGEQHSIQANHDIQLLEGRLKREELKKALFRYLDN